MTKEAELSRYQDFRIKLMKVTCNTKTLSETTNMRHFHFRPIKRKVHTQTHTHTHYSQPPVLMWKHGEGPTFPLRSYIFEPWAVIIPSSLLNFKGSCYTLILKQTLQEQKHDWACQVPTSEGLFYSNHLHGNWTAYPPPWWIKLCLRLTLCQWELPPSVQKVNEPLLCALMGFQNLTVPTTTALPRFGV